MELTNLHYSYEKPKKVAKEAKKLGYEVKSLDRGVAHFEKIKGSPDPLNPSRGNAPTEHVVSVKGTDPSNFKDLVSDFKIAVGLTNKDQQFKERRKQVKNIYKSIPTDHQVNLVGHSLGGSIATSMLVNSKSIRDKTDKADLYNTGYTKTLHRELKENLSKEERQELNDKITHHRTDKDVVSQDLTSGSIGKVMNHESKSNNPLKNHTITGNFDEL